MAELRTAKRYARALFDLARETQVLDAVREDLQAIVKLLHSSPELAGCLQDPLLSHEERCLILNELFAGKAHPLTLKFTRFLDSRHRLGRLAEVCRAFETLYLDHKHIRRVHVVSAIPFLERQRQELLRRLEHRLGMKIEADMDVDPGMIGGFKVYAGTTVLDFSLQAQFERVRRNIISG